MKIDTHNPSPRNCSRLYRFSSGIAAYTACVRVSGRICTDLLLSLCELAVFVQVLLDVILKAHASFISVTVLLATLSVAQAKKKNSVY